MAAYCIDGRRGVERRARLAGGKACVSRSRGISCAALFLKGGCAMLQSFWVYYRYFFIQGFVAQGALLAILVLIGAILFARIGEGMGLPQLFWHENVWKQRLAGGSVMLLVAKVFFFAFLIEVSIGRNAQHWNALLPSKMSLYSVAAIALYMIYGLTSLVVTGAVLWALAAVLKFAFQGSKRRETKPRTRRAIQLDARVPLFVGAGMGVVVVGV